MTTQQQPVSDTILHRIRKLMSLTTERGASENEAALAAEHVQRLLAEHNLSMASIEASGGKVSSEGQRVREGMQHRQVYRWQRTLMQRVADLNFCRALERHVQRGWNRPGVFDGYDLIGRQSNVVTTQVMFDYLVQTIERLAREDVNNDPSQFFTRAAHSFKEGCSDRIGERLYVKRAEMIREEERKAKEETTRAKHPGAAPSMLLPALVDVTQQEKDLNNDFMNGWEPGTTATNRAKLEAEYAERDQRREAERAAKVRKIMENDHSITLELAELMAAGYTREFAEEYLGYKPSRTKPETEKERRKRERAEQREEDRYYRQQQRERERLDWASYSRGQHAGNDVNLNQQVDSGRSRKLQ